MASCSRLNRPMPAQTSAANDVLSRLASICVGFIATHRNRVPQVSIHHLARDRCAGSSATALEPRRAARARAWPQPGALLVDWQLVPRLCPTCHTELAEEMRFCPKDGTTIVPDDE